MRYVRRASPLHAARAAAGAAWCCALAGAALAAQHPIVLAALIAVVLGAALASGVAREVARTALWMLPWALVIALVNTLVVRDGLTVLARLGELPPFGQIDVTLEALVYGLLFGARLLAVSLVFALFTAAVDPDDLLRILRRVSMRSALAAALATRLVPVLAQDAQRIAEARRCRADGGGTGTAARLVVLRAVAGGALDRALDVAATLEVRGYGSATRRSRHEPGDRGIGRLRRLRRSQRRASLAREPYSRHDLAFLASAATIAALAIVDRAAGLSAFETYPLLHGARATVALAVAGALAIAALAPFASRRGIGVR